jgi:HSP20 family protein
MCKMNSSLHFVKRTNVHHGKDTDAHWAPNTDVYVTDAGLVIKVELAGMRREELELTIEGNRLRISGHRPDGCRAPQCKFLVMEINYGAFETVLELPDGYDLAHAKAAYQNGFLRIDVPVNARVGQKTISTEVS